MGARALEVYNVTFDEVRVPAAKIGSVGARAFACSNCSPSVAFRWRHCNDGASAGCEYALNCAKERTAFGEPIAYRQSIAFLLANMRIENGARLMVWEVAYKFDQGDDATKAAVLAKQYADKMVLEVTDGAVQVHSGGHGYVRDHPVELA